MFDRSTSTTTSLQNNNNENATKKPRRSLFRFRKSKQRGRGREGGSSLLASSSFAYDERSRLSVPTAVYQQQQQQQQGIATPSTPKRAVFAGSTVKVNRTTNENSYSNKPKRLSIVAQEAERGWLFRNQRFIKMCDAVFTSIDTDNSGAIDEKELYAGLLLIHLKLGAYAGPAACRPLGRERCHAVFVDMDTDGSGQLDKHEFRCVMIYLFGNVIIRVLVQWTMTLVIVPLVAQYILDAVYAATEQTYEFITTLDEDYAIANMIELQVEAVGSIIVRYTPTSAKKVLGAAEYYLEQVPESVWNSIPLTLLSTVLGIAVVPYIIFSIDEFFTRMAARNSLRKNNKQDKQE